MRQLTHLTVAAGMLMLSLALPGGKALAAEPCPWQATQPAEVCQRWSRLQQQLKAAQSQEKAAQQALQSLENSIQPAPTQPGPAQARARALLDKALAGLAKQLRSLPGGARLVVSHDYALVPRANAYTATLQKAQLTFSDGENRVDLSPLRVTIELLDSDDARVTLLLPNSVPLLHGDQRVATLEIGGQKMTAVWSDAINAIKESHVKLQHLRFQDSLLQIKASLDDLVDDQTFAVAPDGGWHGRQQLNFTGLHVAANGYIAQIGALTGSSAVSGIHYNDFQQLTGQRPTSEKTVATDNTDNVADKVGATLKDVENFRGDVTLRNITNQRNGQNLLALKQLNLGSNLQKVDKNSTVSLHFGFDGLQSSLIPVAPDLTPDHANFQIALANINPELLNRLIQAGIGGEKLPPPERKDYVEKHLLELLSQSGAALQVANTYLAAPAARADLQLQVTVAPAQPLGVVGNLLLTLTGMDNVKQMVGDMPGQESQTAVKVLAAAMAFSNRTVRDGKTIDSFDLQLTRDGKTLLNHKDVTALLPTPQAQKPR